VTKFKTETETSEVALALRDRGNPAGPPENVAEIVAEKKKRTPPASRGRRDHDRPPVRGPPSKLALLRFSDLRKLGVVTNYFQLEVLIRDHQFPPGRWISNNARAWTEHEIEEWLASRPTISTRPPRRHFQREQGDLDEAPAPAPSAVRP
jgi:Prophage CP4-57 regulatory protein (AlpA)